MGIQQFYSVAIYCRLSVDDGNNLESMSIASQKAMLTEYIKKKGWKLYDIYIDDGYSGVNFERPAFQRMIHDIEQEELILSLSKIYRDLDEITSCADSIRRYIFLKRMYDLSH